MQAELTNEEILNNTLAEIHNRLAEISTYLKTGLAIFAKLEHYDTDFIENGMAANISLNTKEDYRDNHGLKKSKHVIGYSSDKGLYAAEQKIVNRKTRETLYPLGDFERTAPIHKETGAFIE